MPEILTESFCERCGTRYTFESTAPKGRRIGRFKTLSKGLKNFVMSDDIALDEALASARSEDERETVAQQLDAFHKTFNFCMSCRQYTCSNCWNEPEGRCLTCAPHLGHEVLPAPFPQLEGNGLHSYSLTGTEEAPRIEASAWPMADLRTEDGAEPAPGIEDLLARDAFLAEPEAGAVAEIVAEAPVAEPGIEASEPLAAEPEAAAEATEVIAPQSMAEIEAVAEPEAVVEAEAEPEVEPVAVEAQAAPVAEAEPVAVEAEAEPVAVEPEVAVPAAQIEQPIAFPTIKPRSAAAPPPPSTVNDRAAAAAAQTAALLAKFRPGQSIDAALEAFEAAMAETQAEVPTPTPALEAEPVLAPEPEPVAAEVQPEPVAAAEVEPEPEVVAVEPEPVAVAEPVAVEPEPVAAVAPEPVAAQPEPVAAIEPEPVAAAPEPAPPTRPADDRVEVPTWRIVAPEPTPINGHPPAEPAIPAAATAEPEWPSQPQWPDRPADQSPAATYLAARLAKSPTDAVLWAASSRDVVAAPAGLAAAPGVQSCVSCGLSLSATARFCRRCGTAQQH